jgi:hypothetical protein
MAAIYGLVSNRDNKIFYVGETYRDVTTRFNEHYWNPKRLTTPLYSMIKRDRQKGFDIHHVVLEYCSFDDRKQRERHWVGGLPNLVNERLSYCWSFLSKEEKEKVAAIRCSRRGGIPNWCGHIGVVYFPHLDAWKVQILHWGNFYVLRGDGGPVDMEFWTYPGPFGHDRYVGDWYFSDGVKAVEARNRERERLNNAMATAWRGFVWPPDTSVDDPGDREEKFILNDVFPISWPEAEDYSSTAEHLDIDEFRG